MPVEVTSIELSFQGWAIWNIRMERLRINGKMTYQKTVLQLLIMPCIRYYLNDSISLKYF